MKKICVMLLLLAVPVLGQQAAPTPPLAESNMPVKLQAPTFADVYCAGWIGAAISRTNYVAAGSETPDETLYSSGEFIFLHGTDFQQGGKLSIVRELKDPNKYEAYKGQHSAVRSLGQAYADVAQAQVIEVRASIAIAKVDFSCQAIAPGDLAVTFQDRAIPTVPPTSHLQMFPAPGAKTVGRIVMGKDFDVYLATGMKAYINAGSSQGLKVGDFLRAVRGLDPSEMDEAERLSYKSPAGDDTQKDAPKYPKSQLKQLPRQTVAELVVLNVTANTATAMVVTSFQSIHVGDSVEMEGAQETTAQAQTQ